MPNLEEQLINYVGLEEAIVVAPIGDGDAYTTAAGILRENKSIQREIDTLRKQALQPVEAERRRINGLIDPIRATLVKHESDLKGAMKSYTDRVEAERRRVEAFLRDEQRKAAEAAETIAKTLREAGKTDEAEAIIESVPSVPIVVSDIPKVSGVFGRKTWKSEVVDFPAFLQWVMDNGMFNLLEVNNSELNALARQQRTATSVPGIRFFEEETVVARS